ncbi:MAG: hypothetical protein II768_10710, partial [Clostridia bacterium]|nr:hypothetical protein [Clostridia bacterium]
MGILKSLFGKKDKEKIKVTVEPKMKPVSGEPILHLKGQPDVYGLYPSELVMLNLAEEYKITETNFPAYLTTKYEIANPAKMLKNLQIKGFIEVGSAKD